VNKTINWVGQRLTLDIEKVAHGGIFVARHEGRVVFVSHVLPGEQVVAQVYEDAGKGFCRAEPIEILKASPDRVKHFWKAATGQGPDGKMLDGVGGAGGAEFGHISLNRQRELKADVIEEALERMSGIKLRPVVEAAPGDDENNGLHYRTRVQLHVGEDGWAGPYRERSHDVIDVKDLPLAVEDINELGLHQKNWQGVSKIEIAASSTGQLQWSIDKKLKGDERLIERVAGRTFRISAGGFWQVHRKAADVLSSAISSAIEGAANQAGLPASGIDLKADNLDLYGGVGLFASTVAGKFGNALKITTIESYKQATEDAKLNLADLPNAKAVCAPVERFMDVKAGETEELANLGKLTGKSTATVILDPPRSGAGGKVIDRILTIDPAHIIYVACDPIALARDLKPLLEAGYELASLRAFDLFPHTHHVEAVASLIRK
jgi:tRNA/tmRNA/rRNA uracil-C5-methylase (TrmA/RlmC/RlmD family)